MKPVVSGRVAVHTATDHGPSVLLMKTFLFVAVGGVCDELRNHWCPQVCVSAYQTHKSDNYSCKCHEQLGFKDIDGNGRYCVPETGRKYMHSSSSSSSFFFLFRLTPPSRPNKVCLKCPSARPYVRPLVRPQKITSISMKFGV